MPPDFARDPYFADLFQAPSLAQGVNQGYNDFYRQQFQQLQNERTGMMNQQMQQQLDIQKTMQEMMQQNPNDPVAAMKAAAVASGNPQAIMQIEREQRMQDQFQVNNDMKIFNDLKQAGHTEQARDFYQQRLEGRFGQQPDEFFKGKPNIMFAPDGTVVDKNSLEPGMRFDRPQREKEPKLDRRRMYKADGSSRYVDLNDPVDVQRAEQEQYTSASSPINRQSIELLERFGILPPSSPASMPTSTSMQTPPVGGNFPPPPAGGNFPILPPGVKPKRGN
jgi:hypothetical protein